VSPAGLALLVAAARAEEASGLDGDVTRTIPETRLDGDAIPASTITLRLPMLRAWTHARWLSCRGLLQNIAMAPKERFPASYVESVGRSGQDVRLA